MKKQITLQHAKPVKAPHNWKIRSVAILSVFVFFILFTVMLVYSYLGLKLTVFALNKFIPELRIEQVDGSLHDLRLKGFSLVLDGVTVKVGDASLSLSGSCLLQARVCIKNFDANSIMVRVNTDQLGNTDDNPAEDDSDERWLLKMPLPIELDKTHLTRVDVYVDDMQFGMSDFTGKAIWVNEKLYVYPSVAQNLKAIFADSSDEVIKSSKTQVDVPINQIISQLFNQPLIDSLPQVNIPLDINVTSLTGNNWLLHMGGQDYHFTRTTIKTEMINNYIMVKQLDTEAKSPYANGKVSATGEITLGDNWPITANINAKTKQDQLTAQFSGQLLGALSAKAKMTGLNQLNLDAKFNFNGKYLPIIADVSGKHFRWPMTDQVEYQFDNFALSLDGSVKKYKLSAKSLFKGSDLPDTQFDLLGNGTNEGITLDAANLKFPQGSVDIKGKLNWFNQLQWNLLTKINRVDLIKELPYYPTKLQGNIETSGYLKNNKWQIDLNKIQLDGSVDNATLSATGAISVNAEHLITANNFKLLWGNNQITADGSTFKEGLTSQLRLASLALIADDLAGSIYGDVKIAGSITKPNIKTNLSIVNFAWQDNFIKKANIVADISYKDQASGRLSITAEQIELLHETINNATLDLSGNESNHKLTISMDGQPASLNSTLIGQLDPKRTRWNITIPNTDLIFGENNRWKLDKPLNLSYDIEKKIPTIGAHCWLNGDSSICLDNVFSLVANNHTTLTLHNIDLAKLPIPNNGETKLAGSFDGKASLQWFDDKVPSIQMNIDSKHVYIQQLIASQTLPIPFDLFSISADFNQKQAKLNWQFSLNEFGKMKGNLLINDPTDKKQLAGQLNLDNLSLSIINPLLQNDDHAKGAINGNLHFSGSLLDPSITGKIDLNSNEIKSNQLPADVTSAAIGINFHGRSSSLNGTLQTKAGKVNITGSADWNSINNWNAAVAVKGAAMEISVPPMVKLTVIPDVKIEANEDNLNLSGSINIPKGNILVESLPASSIDVSSDEVLLDKNNQPIAKNQSNMKINSKLEIILGDNFGVDAFGLNANLKGKLLLQQNRQGLGVNGQITIPNGRFHAYGQDLLIRKGEVTFSGPIDQPMVNIEAIRNPESMEDNVTAGIRVIGTINDAKVDVFADPAMSQQEALSYLLNGEALDSSDGNSNGNMMAGLLIGLGASQGGKYLGNIGDFFGIRNLSLDTKGSGSSSQVVVSGYLFPDLQLKYGVGLFDSLANFTLRYRLMPRLYLEGITGTDQVINFLYQFEF